MAAKCENQALRQRNGFDGTCVDDNVLDCVSFSSGRCVKLVFHSTVCGCQAIRATADKCSRQCFDVDV